MENRTEATADCDISERSEVGGSFGDLQRTEADNLRRARDEALARETALAEILAAINSSGGELQPVLVAVLEHAVNLCEANFGILLTYDGVKFTVGGLHKLPAAYEQFMRNDPPQPGPQSAIGRILNGERVVRIEDVTVDRAFQSGDARRRALAELGRARSYVAVGLFKDDRLLGTLAAYRQEVRPFSEAQISLLQKFAAHAVIALENARLLDQVQARTRELSRSLEELRRTQTRLIQTEKLASLGQLTAGIAHEIKNPLNFVNNFSALSAELTDELKDVLMQERLTATGREQVNALIGLLKDNVGKVVQHGKRADSIVRNMLLHSREGSSERRSVDINALVNESLNLAYHGARAEKSGFCITLKHDLDPNVGAVNLYPQEIIRALLNVISNGFYAATRRKVEIGDETFEPILGAVTRDLGRTVEIRIRDNGTGVSSAVREKMFNPFFTTKPTGEGTGLGLSITHDIIVKQHGGRIDVDTEPGEFTEVIITLPRDDGTAVGEKSE